ncbi:hypothetical protein ACFYKT_17870 [Cytobacillus sp. FJAT-53684]|uniref:Uncharacterized protein n=1 Tax=Cytobacillus mangrovibacter TaxID=3299024 RepID=A0ABW6K657_9BACI
MDYVFLFVGSIIVISCFYFIVSPFINIRGDKQSFTDENEAEMPLEMIYTAVNELEMDFLMKKLDKDDFESMKKRYLTLAAGYLKTENSSLIKRPKAKRNIDETDREILKELNKLRKQKGMKESE